VNKFGYDGLDLVANYNSGDTNYNSGDTILNSGDTILISGRSGRRSAPSRATSLCTIPGTPY